MPLSVNNLVGFSIGSLFGDPINLNYLQTVTSSTDGTSFTFSSQNLGPAASNRYIFLVTNVLFTSTGGNITASSSTVGGATISAIRTSILAGASNGRTGIYLVKVPTGSTGDIVIVTSQTASAVSVSVYSAYSDYVNAYSSYADSLVNPISGKMEIPAGGITLCGSMSLTTTDGVTWTNVNENVDGSWATENRNYTAASLQYSGSNTVTPQVSNAGGTTDQNLALVSFYSLPVAGDTPIIDVVAVENDNTANQSSYTFTGVLLNDPAPPVLTGRRVLIFAIGEDVTSGTGFSSCTINGNSTTLINQTNTSSTVQICMSTFYATVESGTTADIVVNVNQTSLDTCAIIVCTIYGGDSAPLTSNFTSVNNSTTISPSITPSSVCSAICVAASSSGGVNSFSIMTEDVNLNGSFSSGVFGGVARLTRVSSTINETVTIASASDMVAGIVAWAR